MTTNTLIQKQAASGYYHPRFFVSACVKVINSRYNVVGEIVAIDTESVYTYQVSWIAKIDGNWTIGTRWYTSEELELI